MTRQRDGRPAVIKENTAHILHEFLSFRHIVRNVYGFELDPARVKVLVDKYPNTWRGFEADMRHFLDWLKSLAAELEESPGRRTGPHSTIVTLLARSGRPRPHSPPSQAPSPDCKNVEMPPRDCL